MAAFFSGAICCFVSSENYFIPSGILLNHFPNVFDSCEHLRFLSEFFLMYNF